MASDLELLRTLVTVHRAGSFSEAAALLGIAQPTVTAHIKALESSFGVRLFERSPTGVRATARGEDLVAESAPHVDALDDLLSAAQPTAVRTLQLGGPAELIATVLLPRATELAAAAGAAVRVRLGLADELIAALRGGELDVVISATRPRSPGIDAEPLADEEFVLVGAPGWVGHDLDSIPVVGYSAELPIVRRYWRTVFGTRPSSLRAVLLVPDLRAVLAAVISGAGMSVLPRYLAAAALSSGAVVELHRPAFAPLNTVYLATRAGETARWAAVCDAIRTVVRSELA